MRHSFFAISVPAFLLTCGLAQADVITSRVISYDQAKNQLVLSDRTVIQLDMAKLKLDQAPAPGDRIEIRFVGSENGIDRITGVTITR